MNTPDMPATIHEGRNIKRLREILGIKQEALAADLGINQQKMSFIEQKEKIDDELMAQVAKALNVPVEAIKSFNEAAAYNIINCIYHDNSASVHYSFNPIDKLVELYERMIKEKDAQIAKLMSQK